METCNGRDDRDVIYNLIKGGYLGLNTIGVMSVSCNREPDLRLRHPSWKSRLAEGRWNSQMLQQRGHHAKRTVCRLHEESKYEQL